jgi:hypothetical protein
MWLAYDTKITIGVSGDLCENRSLWFERLAGGRLTPLDARAWTDSVRKIAPLNQRHEAWRSLVLARLPAQSIEVVWGRLLDRLGVARPGRRGLVSGLLLDRVSGVPCFSGAVPRRSARASAYHQLTGAKTQELGRQLLEYALVFGWLEAEALDRTTLARTHAADWPGLKEQLTRTLEQVLLEHPGLAVAQGRVKLAGFDGLVRFLPAFPWQFSQCEAELPVRSGGTSGPERGRTNPGEAGGARSLAVPARTEFVFPLVGPPSLRGLARGWLETALAGGLFRPRNEVPQGRFEVAPALQEAFRQVFAQQREALTRARQTAEGERASKQDEERREQTETERESALENMSAAEREDYNYSLLTEEQFRAKVQAFRQFTAKEQLPVIRALWGPRLAFWEDLKRRAAKGGQWAQVEQAIRAAAKKAKLGKMP